MKDVLILIGLVLLIALLAGLAAEITCGEDDRERHRRADAADAAHEVEMDRIRNGDLGREILGRQAGNSPRAAALYQAYVEIQERREREAQHEGDQQ